MSMNSEEIKSVLRYYDLPAEAILQSHTRKMLDESLGLSHIRLSNAVRQLGISISDVCSQRWMKYL